MRLGDYQTLRELRRSGAASLWEVEPVGGGGDGVRRAAKILQPPTFWSDEERAARVARFLARARVQEQAARAGRHWAPVHAMGEDADEAHYVTDLYPATAEQLVRKPKAVMNGVGLFRIVRGVVAGLAELKESAGRAHGRLTAGNVLLTSENPTSTSVALSDPAVDPPRDGEAADCRAVGELIFELVVRRAPEPGELAKASGGWRALGPRRKQWRELCNRLLDPAQPLDSLEGLREAVARCRPPKVSSKRAMQVGVAVSVVVAAAIAFSGYRIVRHKRYVKDWKELCQTSGWLPGFVADLNARGGERLKLILGGVPKDVQEPIRALAAEGVVRPEQIRGARSATDRKLEDDPPEELGNSKVVRQVTTIMAGVRAVETLRDPEKWALLKSAKQLGEEYGRVVVTNRAQALAVVADRIVSGRDRLAANLEDLVEYEKWLTPLHALAGPYRRIESAENTDKTLKQEFEAAFDEAAGLYVDSTAVKPVADLALTAARVERGMADLASGGFDEKRFLEERQGQVGGKTKRAFMEAWSDALSSYKKLGDGENPLATRPLVNWEVAPEDAGRPEAAAEGTPVKWDRVLEGMEGDIEKVTDDAELAERGRAKLAELNAQLAWLKRRPPLVKDKEELAEKLEQFVKQAGEIRRDLRKDDPKKVEFFARKITDEIGRLGQSGDFVEAAWAGELKRVLGLEKWRLGRKQRRVDAVDAFFKQLPGYPTLKIAGRAQERPWAAELAAAAKRQRDGAVRAAIAAVLTEGKEAEAPAMEAQAKSTRAAFDAWVGRAEELGATCAALEDRLDEYPLPTVAGGAGSTTVVGLRGAIRGGEAEGNILAALKPVTDRADALTATAKRTAKDLHDVVAGGTLDGLPPYVESRLAVWRLADPKGLPLGPANDVRGQLLTELAGAANKAAAGEAAKQVNKIWRETIAGPEVAAPAAGDEMRVLEEAVKLLEMKPAPPLTLADLSAAGRYNVKVYLVARGAAGKTVDSAMNTLVAEARQAADGLRSAGGGEGGGGTARVDAVLDAFEAWLRRAQPPPGVPRIDQAGPAGIPAEGKRWKYEEQEDREGANFRPITYKHEATGLRLEFVDLPEADCFMCKSEVSVALFSAVIAAAGPEAMKTLFKPKGGLASWTITSGPIEPSADWLTADSNEKVVNYVANVGDLPPPPARGRSPMYPMQRISPKAAELFAGELNCQIPTVRQWEAALAAELKLNPTGLWNVRDQKSWQNNINGVPAGSTNAPPNWRVVGDPAGAKSGLNDFWLTDANGAFPREGKGVKPYVDDGHLFFQMVDPAAPGAEPPGPWARVGKGARFDHIIGNVAEYVIANGDDKQFLVAGGSAISPQLPLNEHIQLNPIVARLGFPDVGIRLAFKRPVRAYYVRLNEALKRDDELFITRPR